ncbi:MAG: DUF2723 domain-containing protein [Bacteroidetes bacterium]|nr:DUF2723 domain-containing protein [Bacteroidota bacterium]
MNYKLVNNAAGWLVFAIAAFTYISTAESSTSLWDCGEFISAAYKLQVVHPPGAPLFLLIGRIFTLFAGSEAKVPVMMNYFSAISTAFAILFIFWIITALAKKIMTKNNEEPNNGSMIAIIGAGLVGALACTFSDTMWFSAVEGEVYALSTFFIAIVLWGVMKWEANADKPGGNRWLIFIAFMIGLSIGVHLLSLLVIPVTVLIYYFKKYKANALGAVIALGLGFIVLGLVQSGVIGIMTSRAAANELMMVNSWGLPFNMGILIYYLIVFGFISTVLLLSQRTKASPILASLAIVLFAMMVAPTVILGLIIGVVAAGALYFIGNSVNVSSNSMLEGVVDFNSPKNIMTMRFRKNLELFGLAFLFVMLGFSTYIMIPIRSAANTPINMNAPKDAFSLMSYLNREQYGDRPLIYGPQYDAQPYDIKETGTRYYPDQKTGKYLEKGKKVEYIYRDSDKVFFPRLYSSGPGHVEMYKMWVGRDWNKPTQADNFAYFFKYQIGYMWGRYFMWNFSGRQDDYQGTVTNKVYNGNWLSGIRFVDDARLGSQEGLPDVIKHHKSRNTFYMLPFLFGLIGFFFLFFKNERWGFIFLFLFILTGVMLIVYFNSPPREPRERDYTLVGSFYTYCIFIGMGVLALYELLKKYIPGTASAITASIIGLIAVPTIMAANNWDDHNRHDRRMARDFAINFLESCPPNAILFTQGDNDTYPLWYAQEVEGVRPDVRVANLSLIGVDWYIDFLQRAANENGPVPFHKDFDEEAYLGDKNNQVFYSQRIANDEYLELDRVMEFVLDDSKQIDFNRRKANYFPTNKVKITVDRAEVLANNVVPDEYKDQIVDEITWQIPFVGGSSKYVIKNDLAVLAVIAAEDWSRPICFANTVSPSSFAGLSKYLIQEGMMHRLVPVEFKNNRPGTSLMAMNEDATYDRLMEKYQYGGLDEKEHFIDENTDRLMHGLRNLHISLARSLTDAGKSEKAINVLERMKEKFPDMNAKYYSPYNASFSGSLYSYNQTTVEWIELYYKNGRPELAQSIIDVMLDELADSWRFYNLDNSFAAQFQGDLQAKDYRQREKAIYDIQRLADIATTYKDDAFHSKLSDRFPTLVKAKEPEVLQPTEIGGE